MNENIQHIIQEIRIKKDALKDSLMLEQQKVSQLQDEISVLKSDLSQTNEKWMALQSSYAALQTLLEETKAQVVNVSTPENLGYEHIDEMVREIEYCIGQLKNNA